MVLYSCNLNNQKVLKIRADGQNSLCIEKLFLLDFYIRLITWRLSNYRSMAKTAINYW